MADNLGITTGSDALVATDEIGAVHWQKFKLAFGPSDTATAVETGVGLPVALPSNQSVNVSQVGGSTVLFGNGITGAGVARVTIASDQTAFAVNATLQTGANVIGAVTQSGTWNVGSVTTLPALVAGSAIIGKVGIDQTTPGTTNAVSVTNTSFAVTGPLTDTQIRATALPVSLTSTTITGSVAVTGPLTDTQIRATALPVSLASTTITGTAAVSLATAPALVASSAIIGKVGIDQTTPGTTNALALSTVGTTSVNAFPAGFQRVTDEPRQLFYDPFDAALDTTDRWAATTSAGGGVAASTTAGVMTIGSGTTINGYSYLTSRASFTPTVPAWLGNSWAIAIESPVGTNAVRFWGHGIVGGTPSSTSPLGATGNGYGFEIDIAGVLQAVVYAAGTRTVVASLAAFQPADALQHRYICYYRTDRIYWYVDGLAASQLAATSNFQGPQVQALPLLALSVAHSSAPAASRVITTTGLAVWDTGKNNTTLSDGTFGWRRATIKGASTAAAFTDTAMVVETRPGGAVVTTAAALADATANPTLGLQATVNAVYNGATWDRQRGMGGNATTGDTGAKTATGNGATQTNVGNKGVQIVFQFGTVTGTTPTFVGKVQGSADGGTTWFDIPGATTGTLVATGNWGIMIYPGIAVTAGTTVSNTTATANMSLPRTWRVVWTIGGTTPSFTITAVQYNYLMN